VIGVIIPRDAVKLTATPAPTELPNASTTVTNILVVSELFAAIELSDAEIFITAGGPGINRARAVSTAVPPAVAETITESFAVVPEYKLLVATPPDV
jgi:hypothetical protein